MVNYTLQSLTHHIKKSCIVNNSSDPADRYGFSIDINKLEATLKQKSTSLHVLAFNKILESRVPDITDLQLISEYIHDTNVFSRTFDGKSEFVSFMMYSTINSDGDIPILQTNEDGTQTPISNECLFESCNGEELNKEFIIELVNGLPCYRVIVIRLYNYEEDRFDYKVNIRSNYDMVTFQKNNKEIREKSKK